MSTYIRLTDYKDSDSKEQGFFKSENRYEAKQSDFEKIPGSPIAYWVSDGIKEIFQNKNIGQFASPVKGLDTCNNDLYVREWFEVNIEKIGFKILDIAMTLNSYKWFPYNKGGDFRKWYGNNENITLWENDGEVLRNLRDVNGKIKSRPQNTKYYFKKGGTWSSISSYSLSVRLMKNSIFGGGGSAIFPNDDINYMIAFMNSKVLINLVKILNPTLNMLVGDISNSPIIFPKQNSIKQTIDQLTQQCIDISKEEWDSRETSWDFTKNELLKHKSDNKLESAYNNYCSYWREKFYQLHSNEEELNRLFIDIYELGDELTPEVALKDITILKSESIINEDKNIEFKADEIMKQFISYAVGVMFGRYSLDSDGLVVANLGSDALVSQMSDETKVSFPIDEDNVIPVLEDDYFSDDIASRVVSFVKTTFGAESLSENIAFIEKCLGKTIRAYMVKDFYEDHIKRYKKRPIYWMVSSPKKGFMSLSYMHRYTSDLFARVQNNYLREYITKLEGTLTNQEHIANDSSNSPTQRAKAAKEIDRINKKIEELIKCDRESITKFAQNRIELDLDDGVKANYLKFMEILYPIKGME